jgi:hypothetical protein
VRHTVSQPDQVRLDSWKAIAVYLGRDLRTVRRWEKEKGLPVRRVPGGERRAVFAYRHEIDAWLGKATAEPDEEEATTSSKEPPEKRRAASDRSTSEPPASSTASPGRIRWLLTGLGLAMLLILLFLMGNSRSFSTADSPVPDVPIIPRNVEHWLRIGLVNGQPENVAGPFQQLLVVDSSRYAQFEADNLQNVEFFDRRGMLLPSWLESGNSNLSSHTVYWIRLGEGLPASKVSEIYMGFSPKMQNLFNASSTGEGPGLSPTYGQFDNGPSVFLKYANFAGESLPQGWYSGTTPGGKGSVQIKNGVLISHSDRGGGTAYLGSNWVVADNVAEIDLRSEVAINGQEMILVCSASPTNYRWTAYSVGYQNMSGLEIEDNNSGAPSVLATARPNPTPSSVIGFHGGILFANYQSVTRVYPRICGGGYLASSVNTGALASFSFDWIRLRRPPPDDVMPTAIFSQLR